MHKILLFTKEPNFLGEFKKILLNRNEQLNLVSNIEIAYQLLDKRLCSTLIICHDYSNAQEALDVVEYASQVFFQVKIIYIAKKLTTDISIQAFKAGADEVISYPFSIEELQLRINRLKIYEKEKPRDELSFGKLKLLPQQGLVLADKIRVPLRKKEFEILHCLLKFPNTVVTRDMMIDRLWGEDVPMHSTIDSYIRRLRLLLGSDLLKIKTVRGFGYMAVPDSLKNNRSNIPDF